MRLLAPVAALAALTSQRAAAFEFMGMMNKYEEGQLGIYEMPIDTFLHKELQCSDINYLDAQAQAAHATTDDQYSTQQRRLGRRSRKYNGLPEYFQTYKNCEKSDDCARVVFFNAFPGKNDAEQRANVSFDGVTVLSNITNGFVLSEMVDFSRFSDVVTVDLNLTATDAELGDDDWMTIIGSEMQNQYEPFNTERFFRFYMSIFDLDRFYSFMDPSRYDRTCTATLTLMDSGGDGWDGAQWYWKALDSRTHKSHHRLGHGTLYNGFNRSKTLCFMEGFYCYEFTVTRTDSGTEEELSWEFLSPQFSFNGSFGVNSTGEYNITKCISTDSPTSAPSTGPTLLPTTGPTLANQPTPTPTQTFAPTTRGDRYTHPYFAILTDGPYGTMYGFNQTKMDQLTRTGTVVLATSAVMTNVTVDGGKKTRIEKRGEKAEYRVGDVGDRFCEGEYVNTTLYNRTYHHVKDEFALLCVKNDTDKQRTPMANVSFTDMSVTWISDLAHDEQWLRGTISLHSLDMLLPTAAPTIDGLTSNPTPTPSSVFSPTKTPTTWAPTVTNMPTGPSMAPTAEPTRDFENPCNSPPLAESRYYFEPNRIWFVGISGSPREYADSRYRTGSRSQGFTYHWDLDYDYEIHIIDEYGGPTFAPTLAPTFSDTPVYIPSDFISDPYSKQYDAMSTATFFLMFIGAAAFVSTRWIFHIQEKRNPGKWPF